jgi:hypothetical protein
MDDSITEILPEDIFIIEDSSSFSKRKIPMSSTKPRSVSKDLTRDQMLGYKIHNLRNTLSYLHDEGIITEQQYELLDKFNSRRDYPISINSLKGILDQYKIDETVGKK